MDDLSHLASHDVASLSDVLELVATSTPDQWICFRFPSLPAHNPKAPLHGRARALKEAHGIDAMVRETPAGYVLVARRYA